MACVYDKLIEDFERTVGTDPIEVANVPLAQDGQMDFKNLGATTIAIRLGRKKGDVAKTSIAISGPYTYVLLTGESVDVGGVVPGSIIAVSSAAGGKLSTTVLYR